MITRTRLRLKAVVPPGQSLVGVYPQILFRIERFHLPMAPDLFLAHGGKLVPCDGQVHENFESNERTLSVGGFFAFDVRNEAATSRLFDLTVSGLSVDAPEAIEPEAVLGTFTMEAFVP